MKAIAKLLWMVILFNLNANQLLSAHPAHPAETKQTLLTGTVWNIWRHPAVRLQVAASPMCQAVADVKTWMTLSRAVLMVRATASVLSTLLIHCQCKLVAWRRDSRDRASRRPFLLCIKLRSSLLYANHGRPTWLAASRNFRESFKLKVVDPN